LVDQFSITGHNLIPISSSEVDFNSETSIDQIQKIIEINQPDVIINCAGVLGNNQDDFNKIFNINLRSNWIISKYFINNIPTSKQVKIIFIGSSAYKKGKKDYILYASSKAALFNLFEGVSALFENTEVIFGLVNPTRMDTKMIKELTKTPGLEYLDPRDVAHTIINFITTLEKSTYLNL
jgi:short-subunit dehydrogenase